MSGDYGVCVYRRGKEAGTLEAQWFEPGLEGEARKGLAPGGPESGFAGHYQVTYLDEQGEPAAQFDLEITDLADTYQLTWRAGSQVTCTGIGLPIIDGIALAYRVGGT